ncbi:hypothetical protein H310_15278 [Aphanomyces invadans]|uniref:Uncharacterized protein n=1 Tax=Aphanomyces invadans TaxID=157072 RepID=A0A024T989_9STRA|nr:hypothetical protein H310_15278 [Aphanomyces invadans]ETV89882.1 hypothetical protein H310_15278 [Aphanomyces invadans]|eukprot:XP_008881486.1 hypothetical protein H310_15278 [Aphanomyces invadans]
MAFASKFWSQYNKTHVSIRRKNTRIGLLLSWRFALTVQSYQYFSLFVEHLEG